MMYQMSATIEDLPFIQSLRFDIELQLEAAKDLLERALELTKVPGGPAPRAENYVADLEMVAKLSKANEVILECYYMKKFKTLRLKQQSDVQEMNI